jgi:hypothetical protein
MIFRALFAVRLSNLCMWNEVKFSLCSTNYAIRHEGLRYSECIDQINLGLTTIYSWVDNFSTSPFYSKYLLDNRLGQIVEPTGTPTPTPRTSNQYLVAILIAVNQVMPVTLLIRMWAFKPNILFLQEFLINAWWEGRNKILLVPKTQIWSNICCPVVLVYTSCSGLVVRNVNSRGVSERAIEI